MYNKIQILLVCFIVIAVALIGFRMTESTKDEMEEVLQVEDIVNAFHSGWLPYWDYSDAKLSWMNSEIKPEEIIAFGVVYQDEELYMSDETREMLSDLLMMEDEVVYLSFVNDVLKEDGTYIQKDKEFLENFLVDSEKREKYINDIIEMCVNYQVDGVEIDYENIKDDTKLWGHYGEFISELYVACEKNDLGLRAVLAYDTAKYVDLPLGPRYVIMCYNLYGLHSEAGPKADKDFLQLVFEINEVLKPNVSMAFANNGFVWSDDGEINAITQTDAENIAYLFDAVIYLDEESQAKTYEYFDASGLKYEVWYADEYTLSKWIQWAEEAGYKEHALWRYGG